MENIKINTNINVVFLWGKFFLTHAQKRHACHIASRSKGKFRYGKKEIKPLKSKYA